jgi:hypothetical protein
VSSDNTRIYVNNVLRDWFEKQPWEQVIFTVDFTSELGSGNVATYSVEVADTSGTSVTSTTKAGCSESGGVVTIGAVNGTGGKVYTFTSKVTSDETMPNGDPVRFEADIFMRVEATT